MQGIYKIVNEVSGKYYVGSSKSTRERWADHRALLSQGKHDNPFLQNAYNKYGKESFTFEFVEEVLGGEGARLDQEQVYLDEGFALGILYNIARKADCPPSQKGKPKSEEHKANLSKSLLGHEVSEEAKAKTRAKISGKNNPNYGKPCTEKRKAQISKANKGRPGYWLGKCRSEKTKSKIGKALTGKSQSEEAKAKNARAHAKAYPAYYNVETNEYIPAGVNLRGMCRGRHLSYMAMTDLKRGLRKRSSDGWEIAC